MVSDVLLATKKLLKGAMDLADHVCGGHGAAMDLKRLSTALAGQSAGSISSAQSGAIVLQLGTAKEIGDIMGQGKEGGRKSCKQMLVSCGPVTIFECSFAIMFSLGVRD